MKKPSKHRDVKTAEEPPPEWDLRLYVSDSTPQSLAALRNLKELCEEHLAGLYKIEVIDLVKDPQLARRDQILAVPTLVRNLPEPIRKVIGTLSNTHQVLVSLGLPPEDSDACAAQTEK